MRKLTANAVCNIRHAITVEGRPATEVAAKHGISPTTARAVARGDRYSDILQARPIPGFESYLAYPNGRVWSTNSGKFVKAVRKSSAKTKYYNLKNNGTRRSVAVSRIRSELFG